MKFINITFVLFTTASFIVQSKKYPVKVGEKEGIGTVKIISKQDCLIQGQAQLD